MEKKCSTVIGGQAIIEGVMFRNGEKVAYAVRDPKGKIKVETQRHKSFVEKHKVLKLPLIRGFVTLIEAMMIGYKALNYSVSVASEEEPDPHEKKEKKDWTWVIFGISLILSLAFALFMFKYLPLLFANLLRNAFSLNNYIFVILEGFLKILIFISYILLISQLKDMKRVFQYHGAEHKVVNCYEAGQKVTVENVRKFTTINARCGTSFLVFVILISILMYSFIPQGLSLPMMLTVRILALPVIAGISYEILRFSARHQKNIFWRIIIAPGLWVQKLTTKEPDDAQIEVAIKSFKKVL